MEEKNKKMPLFFLIYNIVVLLSFVSLFVILLSVTLKNSSSNQTLMLKAVLLIQFVGILYVIPFYLLPEAYCIFKYKRFKKVNSLLCVITFFLFASFYLLFKLFIS